LPSQVAEPFVGTAHAVHDVVPQLPIEPFETQAPPHRWNPLLHWNPHVVPSHVAIALAGAVHGVQEVPQLATAVFEAQAFPQAW
jgi:hypothetical protein